MAVGVKLSSLLGKKGSLDKLQSYWDVGFFLGASALACDNTRVIQASEKLFKLKAPIWVRYSANNSLYGGEAEIPLPQETQLDNRLEFDIKMVQRTGSGIHAGGDTDLPALQEARYGAAVKQELVDFWMDSLWRRIKKDASVRFQRHQPARATRARKEKVPRQANKDWFHKH
ncbi:mitogen-activated protein kinase kinase kinase 5 isoform X1 [Lates japonicus]|uniref:Mitogen-activated protein kinase kinase kinase 5 isoform X1 n=1 Tax=Lates japonicus TaxID=270547 RepID=A0AAD3M8Z8_LATJO|nr:mitogen-activated protein kinase kinase kinase 5 isoform X1 [Lates japonicus]